MLCIGFLNGLRIIKKTARCADPAVFLAFFVFYFFFTLKTTHATMTTTAATRKKIVGPFIEFRSFLRNT